MGLKIRRYGTALKNKKKQDLPSKNSIFQKYDLFLVKSFLTLSRRRPHHTETKQLICSANQWTGFYMIGTSVMKELNYSAVHEKKPKIFRLVKNKCRLICSTPKLLRNVKKPKFFIILLSIYTLRLWNNSFVT